MLVSNFSSVGILHLVLIDDVSYAWAVGVTAHDVKSVITLRSLADAMRCHGSWSYLFPRYHGEGT